MDVNGNPFELGRIIGQFEMHMDRQTDILERIHEHSLAHHERQTSALEMIEGRLAELPERISLTISSQKSQEPMSSGVRDLTDLMRASYPLVILLMAVFGKATFPQAVPLIRAALEALASGRG
jgi:hypothetical protein